MKFSLINWRSSHSDIAMLIKVKSNIICFSRKWQTIVLRRLLKKNPLPFSSFARVVCLIQSKLAQCPPNTAPSNHGKPRRVLSWQRTNLMDLFHDDARQKEFILDHSSHPLVSTQTHQNYLSQYFFWASSLNWPCTEPGQGCNRCSEQIWLRVLQQHCG